MLQDSTRTASFEQGKRVSSVRLNIYSLNQRIEIRGLPIRGNNGLPATAAARESCITVSNG